MPPIVLRSEKDLAALEAATFGPNRCAVFTAHQMGGCRMGADPARSVVRPGEYELLDGEWRFELDLEDRALPEKWYLGHQYTGTAIWPSSIEEQMAAGIPIGISNPNKSSLKKFTIIEEDLGMLWVTPDTLIYRGDTMGFDIGRSQMIEVERKVEAKQIFKDLKEKVLRDEVLERGLRLDGRKFDEIRSIWIETSFLPRTHGSAVFTRGETQALVTCTLGTAEQISLAIVTSNGFGMPKLVPFSAACWTALMIPGWA